MKSVQKDSSYSYCAVSNVVLENRQQIHSLSAQSHFETLETSLSSKSFQQSLSNREIALLSEEHIFQEKKKVLFVLFF